LNKAIEVMAYYPLALGSYKNPDIERQTLVESPLILYPHIVNPVHEAGIIMPRNIIVLYNSQLDE
jgi:hypothetical protein